MQAGATNSAQQMNRVIKATEVREKSTKPNHDWLGFESEWWKAA